MNDASSTRARIAALICGPTDSKSVDLALPILFKHIDLNEGREFVVLDLRGREDSAEEWLEWLSSGKLPEAESSPYPRLDGGFDAWPRYTDAYADELDRLFAAIRKDGMDVVVLVGDFEGERRSCLVLCEQVDRVVVLVQEGKTPLRDVEAIRETLENAGVVGLSTLMIRRRNAILDWFSKFIE